MRKLNLFAIIAGVVISALFISTAIFFIRAKNINFQLNQSRQLLQKMQDEATRLADEKRKISKENERLQADSMVYVEQNNRLEEDKKKLKDALEETQKKINLKEADLDRIKLQMEKTQKEAGSDISAEKDKWRKDNERTKKEINELKAGLQKERGLYHYNLAVAYTQAGLYDEAIEAYEKSLGFDPGNADAYYNLGLLYKNKEETAKAIKCYRKYLELDPEADDKEEVNRIIKGLE